MKKKTVTKIMSYLLTTAMIVGGLSLSPLTTVEVMADAPTAMNVNLRLADNSIAGISGTSVNTNNAATIYYGAYPDVPGVAGTHGDPIKWRVIGYNGAGVAQTSGSGTATLLAADAVIHNQKFNNTKSNNYFESNLQTQINSIAEKLTLTEKSAVSKRTLAVCTGGNGDNHDVDHDTGVDGTQHCNGITGSQVSDAVMWPLSTDEAEATKSGLRTTTGSSSWWWLRSPGSDDSSAAFVYSHDYVYSYGNTVYFFGSVRPAFHLNLSYVLFSSASGASKSSSFTTTTTAPTSEATNYNTWNLTLYDDNDAFAASRVSTETGSVEAGTSMHLNVTNIGTPINFSEVIYNQLSAMLVDDSDNTVVAYGKIKELPQTDNNLAVTIPRSVSAGTYKLKVFAEDVNSSESSNLTDYASKMVDIPVTVTGAKYGYNTPSEIANNGVTATVTYDKDSPQLKDASVKATVTLSGIATAAGTHTIGMSSNTVTIAAPATTKHVAAGERPADTFDFTFTVGEADISDITLTHTFVADSHTITVTPMSDDFGTVQSGYSRPSTKTFTIKNTGNVEITGFSATSDNSDFEVVSATSTIAAGSTATFTVQPKEGMPVGNHMATVTVDTTPAQETPVEVQVNFSVTNASSSASHHDDSDNSGSSSTTTEEAYVNPLVWGYAANQLGSMCLIEHQGELCVAAFNAATPKGYKEAFSFNLLFKENGIFKPSHVKKSGKFVLNIPKEWQKPGRTFILIGIDKFGNTKTFSDIDFSDETFTTMLDVEGYAFSLIYTDESVTKK